MRSSGQVSVAKTRLFLTSWGICCKTTQKNKGSFENVKEKRYSDTCLNNKENFMQDCSDRC